MQIALFGRTLLIASVLLCGVGVAPALELVRTAPSPGVNDQALYAAERLAKILDAVHSSNAPNLIGMHHWEKLVATHREAIEACTTHGQFAHQVNRLLAAGGVSHFHYYTDEDWEYWHTVSAFDLGDGNTEVEHVGIIPERIDGRWFVRGILEGSVADGTDIAIGDELLSVDGRRYSPVAAFRGTHGRSVELRLRRGRKHFVIVTLTPVRESLFDAMERAMRESVRVVVQGSVRMAYLHGWMLLGAGREYADLLELQEDVDGLLLDYRDGFGGTWHRATRFLLGRRDGRVGGRDRRQWIKPVVILTDDGTRSAKEIVVDAVRQEKRAPLVGEATPGAVTSVGGLRLIGDDGLLMFPGQTFSLEGHPAQPDFLVRRDIRYCAGADPQLDFATILLTALIDGPGGEVEAEKEHAGAPSR